MNFNAERPAQLGLPEIGDMPIRICMTNLKLCQLMLHRCDLLIDCIIKYINNLRFEVVSPDYESGIRIQKWMNGDNDA